MESAVPGPKRPNKKRTSKPSSRPKAPPQPRAEKKAERPLRMNLVQAAVLEVYGSVRSEGYLADRALERVLRRETGLFSSERRAVAESVYGLLRQEKRLDFAMFGEQTPSLPASDLHALRFAALRVLEGEDPAIAAQTHAIAPKLRARLERVRQPLPNDLSPERRIELEGSLPPFIARLLLEELGADEALQFTRAIGQRAPLTVRTNTLKATRDELAKRLAEEGVPSHPTKYSPLGLTLETRINAFSLGAFRDGWFEIQDEGSQLLTMLVGARPKEQVFDTCAGAGGKTLALAAEMRNSGELHALDVDPRRLEELSRRARRADVHNTRVKPLPADPGEADAFIDTMRGRGARVLIDAPCSGLGSIRRNPDARYRLNEADLTKYPALQTELLERFARLVKPGGRLVYATCSIARAENEAVVERFLASGAPFEVVPADSVLGFEAAKELVSGPYLRTFPHRHGSDGFFAAVLKRRS